MSRPAFSKSVLARILDASPDPAYLLDDRRRCVFANQSLLDWLQVSADELSQQVCDYHSESPWGALCPPPFVFEQRRPATGRIHRPNADVAALGHDSWEMQFVPIADGDEGVSGVFCFAQRHLNETTPDRTENTSPEQLHEYLAQFRQQQSARYRLERFVGKSAAMRRVRDQIQMAVQSKGRVLVIGPHGSGREHVVRTIHTGRQRPAEPVGLVSLTCSLLDAELLRTTLTALIQQCAQLERAQPPSLLLSEVDQLAADAQVELEGFLAIEELELRTLATARTSLLELAEAGAYRRDLAYSLASLEIRLPMLRSRSVDIPPLAQWFVQRINARGGTQRVGFSTDAMEQLVAYPWPNEVDELEQVVESCCASASHATIQASELPSKIRLGLDAVIHPPLAPAMIELPAVLADIERALIREALKETKQNKAEAARRLGISRNKLLRRISQLAMDA